MTLPRASGLALVLLIAAYANHFGNGFHFDDDHTIVGNPFVRSVRFVPRYFVDATTFSILPLNQTYRPVTQTTFAIDYAIDGYDARVFQADTFVWFVLLLGAIYALARSLLGDGWAALASAAIFGLHPAIADTVNYIVQRGEVFAALGVVSGLAIFVLRPEWRRNGVYLLPPLAAFLAKQTAAVFPLLLIGYLVIYERRRWARDAALSLAAFAVAATWVASRTPATAAYASPTPIRYLLTQPFIALRYFGSFFAPVALTADPDWALVEGVSDPAVYIGAAFVIAIVLLVWRLQRAPSTRAVAFGLAWFLIAQLPTALVPLTEVGNDWRMFLPFIGLSIAVVGAVSAVAQAFRPASARPLSAALKGCATGVVTLVLLAEAVGVHARNGVWRTDESLWRDATLKSPENPRAWMNYGVALTARGDYAGSVDACERALVLAPEYTLVHVNLGIGYAGVNRQADAEREFLTAQRLAPDDWRTHLYYAQWLERERRVSDARRELDRARTLNPLVDLPRTHQ
jgi:hypothetical protein